MSYAKFADGAPRMLVLEGRYWLDAACTDAARQMGWEVRTVPVAIVGSLPRESVAVLDLATKSLRPLADFTYPDHLDNAPTWSPDGRTIAFDILHWDPTGDFIDRSVVATVPVAGGEIHRLTRPDTFMSHPDWSPDGSEIVMGSYDLGNIHSTAKPSNLYLIKSDGSGLRQLTHSSVDGLMRIGTPHWDPDGSRIAVSVLTATGPAFDFADVHLAFVDAAGGEPELISSTESGKNPDVRPTP